MKMSTFYPSSEIKVKLIRTHSFLSHVKICFQALSKPSRENKEQLYVNQNVKQNAHNSSLPVSDSIKGSSLSGW